MNAPNDVLIRLEGVTKVFYTDEVETHALAGIHLEIRNGEYLAIAGPSGCGKSTLLSILGLLDYADRRQLHAEQQARREPDGRRAGAHAQPRDRVHLPELQPDWRPDGLRERRAAAHLPRHEARRAPAAGRSGARTRRHGAPRPAPPEPALRRSAAARRRGPGRRRPARHPARRRADRQPRLEERRVGDGAAPGTAPAGATIAWSRTIRATRGTPIAASTSSTGASSRRTWRKRSNSPGRRAARPGEA